MSHEVLPAVYEVTGYTGPREKDPTGLYRADPEASARTGPTFARDGSPADLAFAARESPGRWRLSIAGKAMWAGGSDSHHAAGLYQPVDTLTRLPPVEVREVNERRSAESTGHAKPGPDGQPLLETASL